MSTWTVTRDGTAKPMPKLIDRQIIHDDYGYHCIDTFDVYSDYPIWGYGYTEEEAIEEADRQARRMFRDSDNKLKRCVGDSLT